MPAAVTHFSITELPDSNVITSLINGGAITLNTLYPIANESLLTFDRTATFNNKAVNIFFKFKTHDNVNNLESNEALGKLEWSGANTPASANLTQFINNSDSINMLNILPLNDSVEDIKIISLEGVLNLTLKGLSTYVGQILSIVDLYYTVFNALLEGGGLPYFKMTYQVGKDNVFEATIYDLVFNITASADLDITEGPDVETASEDFDEGGIINTYVVNEETTTLEVSSGQVYGTAQVRIAINSAFLALNSYNLIEIVYGSEQLEVTSNQTIDIEVDLDILGKADIVITNYAVEVTPDPIIGQITVTLLSINNQAGLVNGSQIVNINTNL